MSLRSLRWETVDHLGQHQILSHAYVQGEDTTQRGNRQKRGSHVAHRQGLETHSGDRGMALPTSKLREAKNRASSRTCGGGWLI